MDAASDTSSVFTLTDSLAEHLFRDVPGEKSKYQSLNEHYFWPYDDSMQTYERLSLQWQSLVAEGSLFYEPTARKGELARMLNEAGQEGRVLDVGCGVLGLWPSAMAVVFPLCECVGIDLAPSVIEYAPPNVSLEVWDAVQGLPFRNSHFDAIRLVAMAPFIPKYDELLVECLRCLKPNGLLIVAEPECVLYNETSSHDWISLQRSVSAIDSASYSTIYPALKETIIAARTPSLDDFKTGFTFASSQPLMFREIFEHEITVPVGVWPGLTPHENSLGLIKREILLLLWRNRLLDPSANQAKVCEQLAWMESLVENPRAKLVTKQKLIWAKKQG